MYYDASNTQKSWKGAPTTNILEGNLSTFNDIYGNSSKTVIGSNEVQWINTSAGPTTVRLYVPQASLTNAQTYGLSVYVKDLVGTVSFDWCDQAITGVNSLTNTPGRLSGTASRSSYDSTYRFLDINLSTGGRMTLYNPQVDSVSYVTPYVSPTTSRSNTQAIVDLAGNNTITATSLTYSSDGTFSFDGSGNYIDVTGGGFTSGLNSYSIMHWSRRDAENRMPISFRVSPTFYQYGDNSWYYTHSSGAGEYYYPKSVSIPLGTWGFYCIVYDGAYVNIYRNGVFEGRQATTGTANWSNGLRIGNYYGSGYYYQGKINSVSFYNRALSAGEVAQNFSALRGRYGV